MSFVGLLCRFILKLVKSINSEYTGQTVNFSVIFLFTSVYYVLILYSGPLVSYILKFHNRSYKLSSSLSYFSSVCPHPVHFMTASQPILPVTSFLLQYYHY